MPTDISGRYQNYRTEANARAEKLAKQRPITATIEMAGKTIGYVAAPAGFVYAAGTFAPEAWDAAVKVADKLDDLPIIAGAPLAIGALAGGVVMAKDTVEIGADLIAKTGARVGSLPTLWKAAFQNN